jgi:hypothetical protein
MKLQKIREALPIVVALTTAWSNHGHMVLKMGWTIAIYSICGVAFLASIVERLWEAHRKKRVPQSNKEEKTPRANEMIDAVLSGQSPAEVVTRATEGKETRATNERRLRFLLVQEKWKDDLDKPEDCPASDCKSKGHVKKRREFYRPFDPDKIRLPMMCSHCFKRLFSVWPQIQHQRLRVWRDNLPCSVPSCSEDAIALGADNNPYCNGHMHKGGILKDAVIT